MDAIGQALQGLRAGYLRLIESDISAHSPFLKSFFFYASPKYIHIDYWFIGCLVRAHLEPDAACPLPLMTLLCGSYRLSARRTAACKC